MSADPHRLTFADHRRSLSLREDEPNRYIYAVISRRSAGLSIGVNLNPDKACNFDCPYCQVDRRTPGGPRAVDLERLAGELDHLLGLVGGGDLWSIPPFDTAAPALRRVNDIAFAGDGEPTAAANFAEAVRVVGAVRAAHGLHAVRLHLLTNATLFHRSAVAQGLDALDALGGEIWAKLDAGTEAWFRVVDGTDLPFARVLTNLQVAAQRRPIVIQSMWIRWEGQGPPPGEAEAFVGRLAAIQQAGGQLRQVQLYSVARAAADARVGVLPAAELEAIAEGVRAIGLDAVVYPGIG